MKIGSSLVIGCIATLVASESAALAPEEEFARTGPYIAIGASWGKLTEIQEPLEAALADIGQTGSVEVEGGVGLNGRLGWRLHANLAAELVFDYIPESVNRVDGEGFSTFETGGWTVNMKPYLLTGRIQPFVQIGFGVQRGILTSETVDRTATENGIAGRFGGGVDVYVTHHIAITADVAYMLPTGSIDDLDQVLVGLGMLFRY